MILSPPAPPITSNERSANANTRPTPNHEIGKLVGNGSFGFVWRIAEDRVLKEPKIHAEKDAGVVYSNMVNRAEILNEKAVYERLGSYPGIIKCLRMLDESIELAYANQGDMSAYIQTNPMPLRELRVEWIRLLVDTFSYAHARRVVIQDISLRNILIHDNSLKLSDFGESALLPLETDMKHFCVNDTTPQIEILHLGCLLYSIAVWREIKYNYFDTERWPEAGELPATDDILFASIIKKCWSGEYDSMDALQADVHDSDFWLAEMCYIEPATPRTWNCGHTTLDPEKDTPTMCTSASNENRWCDPPYERASKGSSRTRTFACPACRNKGKSPDAKDDGSGTGAGGSTSTVQTQQSGVVVGA